MVVTSTSQEVQQQYELYDHYVPSRMEVIPPGVDLSCFSPVQEGWQSPQIATELGRFLCDPEKPIILAMARPDERKNLETLVRVYGESEALQNLANLVVVMGSRDDLRELPKAQQQVINNVLYLIDRYDLYGKVAYPKTHLPDDVPELYRLAASTKGVFVNPALTEPFGLTLLEAGATGLPIVATDDGGPRDIIANCDNGLLVDPTDEDAIERALLRTLTEPEQWGEWSANGISGTREHYSWHKHATRYLRDLRDILEHSPAPALVNKPVSRRSLPEFDRLIITDLDNTLIGDNESLAKFVDVIRENEHVGFGIATGRRLDNAMALFEELDLPRPDLMDTDVGTQLHYGPDLTPDRSWRKSIGYAWQPDEIRKVLDEIPGLSPQPEEHQSEFKISYEVDTRVSPTTTTIKKTLREAGLRAKVVLSLGMYLDLIPVRGGSDLSMRHVLWKWGFAPEHVLVAGDSGNDAGMLLGRTLGVVVANHSKELNRLRNRPRVYFAESSHAAGILEGINYYNFLDKIVIPNDRIE
jgi:sucrose-phosphate synthase